MLAVAALACGGGERSFRDVAGITVDATPLISIGVEEGEEPYQLDRVFDAMIAADGRIVISNSGSNELRIFDTTGTFVSAIGRRGEGPMEFGQYSSGTLHANASTVLAADEVAMRVHVLTPDLQFRETRRFTLYPDTPRPFLRGLTGNGDWIVQAFANGGTLSGQPGQPLESSYQLLRYDSLGAMRDTILSLPGRLRIVNEFEGRVHFPFVPLTSEPLFAVDGDRLIVVSGSAPAMQIYSLDGEVLGEQVWDRPRVRTADVWDEYRAKSAAALSGTPDSARYADFHGKALPLPEFAPMYTGVLVDDAGRIWLERFRMPGDSTRLWDLLDREGTLLGGAETPASVTVMRITNGTLLGRTRDSLGVERVRLYRVRDAGQ